MSLRDEGKPASRRASHPKTLAAAIGALLVLLGTVHAEGAEPSPKASTAVVVSEQARARFEAGVQLLQDPDGARYEEAYEEFEAAYADSPSWKILGNLALCAMKLERDGEAISALERSISEGGAELDPADRTQQEQDLKLLKSRVATLNIRGPAGTTLVDERVTVNGAAIKNRYRVPDSGVLAILVRPGTHRVTAQFETGPQSLEATLAPAGVAEVTLEPRATPPAEEKVAGPMPASTPREPAGPSRIPAFFGLGVGAAGVIVGAVFLGLHLDSSGQASSLYESCKDSLDCGQSDISRIQALDSDAATQGTVSLISFGVGAIGIGTGIALLIAGPKKEAPPSAGFDIRPYAAGHSFGFRGQF